MLPNQIFNLVEFLYIFFHSQIHLRVKNWLCSYSVYFFFYWFNETRIFLFGCNFINISKNIFIISYMNRIFNWTVPYKAGRFENVLWKIDGDTFSSLFSVETVLAYLIERHWWNCFTKSSMSKNGVFCSRRW